MKYEIDFKNYESGNILEITLDRENGEIILPYIFQGIDNVGKPNLRYYDTKTGKIGNKLNLGLTSITDAKLLNKQDI